MKPKRRWLRFSLRTLLVLTLLLGCGFGWVGVQRRQAKRHVAVVKEIEKLGGSVVLTGNSPTDETPIPYWKEWLFGTYVVRVWTVNLNDTDATDSVLVKMKGMNCYHLSLKSTKITNDGLTDLNNIEGLTWLYLNNTHITNDGLQHLKDIESIMTLDLDNTKVTDDGLPNLKGLKHLRYLNLNNTQITDLGLARLPRKPELTSLDLRNTQITDKGLYFLGFTSLYYLYLDDTQITDEGLEHLDKLNQLRFLQMKSTNVTNQGVDRLHLAIPRCTIMYSPIETKPESTPP